MKQVWQLLLLLAFQMACLPPIFAQSQNMDSTPAEEQNTLDGGSVNQDDDDSFATVSNTLPDAQFDESIEAIDVSKRQQMFAAQAADLRIGFVNFRRIMASIPQLKSVSATLDREFNEQKIALAAKQAELSEMEQQLAGMSRGDAYSDYEKQVIAKRRDYVRDNAAYRDAYSVRRNEELAKLQRIVVDEIVALAQESDFDIILNDTGVIYVSEQAELTSIVIERLRAIGE